MADQNKDKTDGKFYSEILRFVVAYVDPLTRLVISHLIHHSRSLTVYVTYPVFEAFYWLLSVSEWCKVATFYKL